METKLLSNNDIPWNNLSSLGDLTCLIYDFMKNWNFTHIDRLNSFLKDEKGNDDLCEQDINLLKDLKHKYPHGSVLKFFTNSTDLQCAVCKSPTQKKFAIIFRGSESAMDWFYDLMVWKTKFQYGEHTYGNVHSGFYNQIMKDNFFTHLCSLVENEIKCHPDYEWYLAGHSAGAAHSILTGFLLAQSFNEKQFIISSLAAPRVGDKTFYNLFQSTKNLTHYRICYNRDIITSVPMIGYYHTGICLLYIDGNWVVNGKYSFYIYRCWSISDHSVDHYIKALSVKE